MFPNDPTLYGATLPQRDFTFMNPYFAQWNQQFPWPTYGQQFPLQYGQQFPLPYAQQIPLPYGQQVPWSFYPRVNQPFAQNEFVPPVLPFQGPITGKGIYGQVPYLPFPQSNFNFPQFKMQLPYAF